MTPEEWQDGTRRTLGMYLAWDAADRDHDEAYLIWFHAGSDAVQVELPDGHWANAYTVVAHSGREGELPLEKIPAGSCLQLPGRTVVLLQVD